MAFLSSLGWSLACRRLAHAKTQRQHKRQADEHQLQRRDLQDKLEAAQRDIEGMKGALGKAEGRAETLRMQIVTERRERQAMEAALKQASTQAKANTESTAELATSNTSLKDLVLSLERQADEVCWETEGLLFV